MLYRAGLFEAAVRRLEEAVRVRDHKGIPADWLFLALAHQRLDLQTLRREAEELLKGVKP